jgi:hypothetical protein
MKILALVLAFSAISATAASAQYLGYGTGSNPRSTYVEPHITRQGTHVDGHYRTTPNNTQLDNYGTRGNYNPHNGTFGTQTPRCTGLYC